MCCLSLFLQKEAVLFVVAMDEVLESMGIKEDIIEKI
jgi:hypothetical protein